jgi:putative redox protein
VDESSPVVVQRRDDGTLEARARDVAITVGREGDGLRSVELLLAALGSCTLGTMLAFAENAGVDLAGVRLELEPVIAERPERIGEIRMTIHVGGDVDERRLASLRRVAEHCKIHQTLEHGPALALELHHR